MTHQTSKSLGDASIGVVASSQLVAWIEAHHTVISLGIGLAGLCLAAFFYYLNYRLNRHYKEREYELKREKLDREKWLNNL